MNFAGKAIPMSRLGLTSAMNLLGLGTVETAALWAVFEVETAGTTQGFGFRADKRPQILFERHVFRAQTGGRFNATHPGISGSPGGYGSVASQYDRLGEALQACRDQGLGEEPALCSASWGIGQVMGFNHQAAGFPTAGAMVQAMVDDEDAQLLAMSNFLASNGLAAALRQRDWVRFARGYNGPAFAQNHYDVKLQEQYSRFSSGSMPDIEVRGAQAALLVLGYGPGKIDGVLGNRTRTALKGFQLASQLDATGELTADTYAALRQAAFS